VSPNERINLKFTEALL